MKPCELVMQSLGFACHQMGNAMVLNTPFQSMIDGDMLQLFIEPIEAGYRITDHGMTLHHAHTHGIDTSAKSQQLKQLFPHIFDDQGKIIVFAKDKTLPESLGAAFNALQAINQHLPKWQPKPDSGSQFRTRVAHYFDQREIVYKRNYAITGRSGHAIRFPFSVESSRTRSLVHCIAQGKTGIDWNNAYSISGQMADVKSANLPHTYRNVIIDDEGIDQDTLGYLANLLSDSAAVLPYSTRDGWVHRLSA